MEPLRSVAWIMLNPSTADARINDPTIRRLISYATRWGYNGIDVVNLFAGRAVAPSDLTRMHDPIGPENDRWILDTMRDPRCAVVIVAWGSNTFARKRARDVARFLRGVRPLQALKRNDDGSPAHPLYLKSDLLPTSWEEA
jgi:hypothetical protein